MKNFIKNKLEQVLNFFGSIRADLVWHEYVSYIIFMVTFALLYGDNPNDTTMVLSSVVTISAGLFKEGVIDMYFRGVPGNRADVMHDLVGLFLGILTGFLFI